MFDHFTTLRSKELIIDVIWKFCDNCKGFRSSRPKVFCKKGVLRNFAKFTGKHLCQRLFFNKVAGLSPATLLKRSHWHRCFPVTFEKFLRTPFFTKHLRWLLLGFGTLSGRRSYPELFYKKDVFANCICTIKEALTQEISCEFCQFF